MLLRSVFRFQPSASAGSRFFSATRSVASGHSHGGQPCTGHGAAAAAPYHELAEGAQSLEALVKGSPKAFVYFTASWCGPCRKIAPFFSDLAAQHGGSVKFVKVDVDANPATAEAVRKRSRCRARVKSRGRPPPLPHAHTPLTSRVNAPLLAGLRVLHPHVYFLCGRQAHVHVHRGEPRVAHNRGECAAVSGAEEAGREFGRGAHDFL